MLDHKPIIGETVTVYEDPDTETTPEGTGIVIANTKITPICIGLTSHNNKIMKGYFLIEFPPEPQTAYRFISWTEKAKK